LCVVSIYNSEGNFLAKVKVTDRYGAQTQITNSTISVEVSSTLAPTVSITASPAADNSPLTVHLTATATLFDGSSIVQWKWDLDGDGNYESTEGTNTTDIYR